jgi:pilus assembly protein FimV
VAEADVYLAYGRDLQAEEILKEAMRSSPDRLAVRTKLLEVYAKRRDAKGFELLATQLYALTRGQGADWAKAQEMGRGIDPENQLYEPGGHPEEIILDGERVVVEPLGASTLPASVLSAPTQTMERPEDHAGLPDSRLDLDLDLDLDLGASEPTQPAALMDLPRPAAQPERRAAPSAGLDFDFADPPPAAPLAQRGADAMARTVASRLPSLDSMAMDLDDPTLSQATSLGGETVVDFGEFGLSQPAPLDGDDTTAAATLPDMPAEDADPMARKLELAEEFRQIGDLEGARDLLDEVIAKAGGALRAKALAMLESLG